MKQEALYRLRALKMIELRLTGKTNIEIGKVFGVSDQTVNRSLKWAESAGLMEDFEQQIINDLVPTAIKTAKDAMALGDAKVAIEVLKGIGLFKKHSDKKSPGAPEEDLESYIRKKRVEAGNAVAELAEPLPSITEVRLLEGQLAEAGPDDPQAPSPGVVTPSGEDRPQE